MVQSIEDYCNISNRINSRRSQTSILLYFKFLVFFRWRAVHESACKGLHESTENCWSSFQGVNLEHQSPLGIFLRDKTVFDSFFEREVWHHVSNTRMCTQKISFFHVFPKEGNLSFSAQKKYIIFSGENTIFSDNKRRIMSQCHPF